MNKHLLIGLFSILYLFSASQIILNNDTIIKSDISGIDINNLPFARGEVRINELFDLLPGIYRYEDNGNNFSANGMPAYYNVISIDNAPFGQSKNIIYNTQIAHKIDINTICKPSMYNNAMGSTSNISYIDSIDKVKIGGQITQASCQVTTAIPITKKINIFFASNYFFGQLIGNNSEEYSKITKLPYLKDTTIFNDHNDIYTKLNYKPNAKNLISLSFYRLYDKIGINQFYVDESNQLYSLSWQNNLNTYINLNSGFSYFKNKDYKIANNNSLNANLKTEFDNIHFYTNIDHKLSNLLDLTYGGTIDYYKLSPLSMFLDYDNYGQFLFENPDKKAIMFSSHISNSFLINKFINIYAGLKYTSYNQLGEGVQYILNEGIYSTYIYDTIHYSNGEIMQTYNYFLPVFKMVINPFAKTFIEFEIKRDVQPLKYYWGIIDNNSYTNNDFTSYTEAKSISYIDNNFTFSTNNIKPTTSNTIGLTIRKRFVKTELSFMSYYTQTNNNNIATSNLHPMDETYERYLQTGTGSYYGFIISANKSIGKLKALFNINVNSNQEEYAWYSYKLTQPYSKSGDITLVMSYDFAKNWNISSISKYYVCHGYYTNSEIIDFPNRIYKIHLAINKMLKSKHLDQYISFGLYNLLTPYTIENINGEGTESLFGIAPYLKYRFMIN